MSRAGIQMLAPKPFFSLIGKYVVQLRDLLIFGPGRLGLRGRQGRAGDGQRGLDARGGRGRRPRASERVSIWAGGVVDVELVAVLALA